MKYRILLMVFSLLLVGSFSPVSFANTPDNEKGLFISGNDLLGSTDFNYVEIVSLQSFERPVSYPYAILRIETVTLKGFEVVGLIKPHPKIDNSFSVWKAKRPILKMVHKHRLSLAKTQGLKSIV
jgi:hypothetical protein